MSIRPIDIVTIAPKSQEASQLQANQMTRSEHAHAQIAETFNRNVEREREQTTKTNKSEKDEYNFDPREESRNSYKAIKKKKRKKEDQTDDATNKDGGHIDIKI